MRVGKSALPASNELAGAKTRLIREAMETYFQTLIQDLVKKWAGNVIGAWIRCGGGVCELRSLQPPPGTRDLPRSSEIFNFPSNAKTAIY
jgi:hypothetical protein